MNYSAVAPPSNSSSESNTAYADALARARQIAAKINQPSDKPANPLKRSFDDSFGDGDDSGVKKAATGDQIESQLRAIADHQRASQAVQAAAAAASQINAKLGVSSSNMDGMGMMDHGGMGGGGSHMPHAGLGMMTTEDFSVPDRMVGLIIGKGGEQIAAIQSETGCKVQFAPDSAGMPDRPCQLMGTTEAITEAKKTIDRIIQKGQGLPDTFMGDQTMLEVMIPGNKVGLVIGKGGETIKNLQENAGVKMVMIQDSNAPSSQDKPLRITGGIQACQKAKELVMDLIAERDNMGGFGGGGGGGGGEYGGRNAMEIPVPRGMVGVVIGKGGEMIKKIQFDTGAKVQFKTDDGQGPNRMCCINGPQDKVNAASAQIRDLIDNAIVDRRGGGGGGGRRRDMDFNGGGSGGGYGGGGGFGQQDETMFAVPAEKCGLVIGKGGETIREINRQSGAHVELDRNQSSQSNSRDRVFRVQGNQDQIQTAIRLISEKAGMQIEAGNGGPSGGGYGGDQGGYGGYGSQAPMQNQQFGGPQGGQHQQQQFNAPQGWGGNNYSQQWNQSDQDPKQADANAQAWQAYYQQYYNSNQQQQGGAQNGQPPQGNGQPPTGGQQPGQQGASTGYPTPSVNPQTGQLDYSAAWAAYYQRNGMHYHAQAILQQQQQGGQQPPSGGGGPPAPQ